MAHLLPDVPRAACSSARSTTLTRLLEDPRRPLVAVLGGAKVTDKIAVIERFLEVADAILIGGAMCFPFFRAQGHEIGRLAVRRGGPRARAARARAGAERADCRWSCPATW